MAGLVEMAGAGRWTREGGRWVPLGPAPATRPRDPRHRQEVRTKAKTDNIKPGLTWFTLALYWTLVMMFLYGLAVGRTGAGRTSF